MLCNGYAVVCLVYFYDVSRGQIFTQDILSLFVACHQFHVLFAFIWGAWRKAEGTDRISTVNIFMASFNRFQRLFAFAKQFVECSFKRFSLFCSIPIIYIFEVKASRFTANTWSTDEKSIFISITIRDFALCTSWFHTIKYEIIFARFVFIYSPNYLFCTFFCCKKLKIPKWKSTTCLKVLSGTVWRFEYNEINI